MEDREVSSFFKLRLWDVLLVLGWNAATPPPVASLKKYLWISIINIAKNISAIFKWGISINIIDLYDKTMGIRYRLFIKYIYFFPRNFNILQPLIASTDAIVHSFVFLQGYQTVMRRFQMCMSFRPWKEPPWPIIYITLPVPHILTQYLVRHTWFHIARSASLGWHAHTWSIAGHLGVAVHHEAEELHQRRGYTTHLHRWGFMKEDK